MLRLGKTTLPRVETINDEIVELLTEMYLSRAEEEKEVMQMTLKILGQRLLVLCLILSFSNISSGSRLVERLNHQV